MVSHLVVVGYFLAYNRVSDSFGKVTFTILPFKLICACAIRIAIDYQLPFDA